MEDKTDTGEINLFLPSGELAQRVGETSKWEGRLSELVEARVANFGRPIDWTHTKAVVNWATILGHLEDLGPQEREAVKAAAWIHDVGYDFSQAKDAALSRDAVKAQKKSHATEGVKLASQWYNQEEVLRENFDQNSWNQVLTLVEQHDDLDKIESGEYGSKLLQILLAADTLGALDLRAGVVPSFSREDLRKYLAGGVTRRLRLMKSDKGRQAAIVLVNQYLERLSRSEG